MQVTGCSLQVALKVKVTGCKSGASCELYFANLGSWFLVPGSIFYLQLLLMKKYIYYITLTSVLIVIAIILLLTDKKGTLKFDYTGFSVKDTLNIISIRIQKNNSFLVLERKAGRWTVNKKYNANTHLINKLLDCIRNVEVAAPVPKHMKNEIIYRMRDSSIVVSISSQSKIVRMFRFIDSQLLNGESIAIIEGENEPYVVHSSGFENKLSKIFTTNALMWRERLLFHYKPYEIKEVTLDYNQKSESSFILKVSGEDYFLQQFPVSNKITKISKEKGLQYFLNFKSVPFHWIYPARLKYVSDSLSNQPPFCKIKVTDIDNQVNIVNIYQIPEANKKGGFNLDKMYAQFQRDSIPVIVKYIDIDPIIKEFSDF